MFHGKGRGCRSFQQHFPIRIDSLWISEDTLCAAYCRFCAVSKTTRRHGSYVPGVLHSRTRVGRRRMAHMLPPESIPPQSAVGILLGLWSDLRGTARQWIYDTKPRPWQPPRPRPLHKVGHVFEETSAMHRNQGHAFPRDKEDEGGHLGQGKSINHEIGVWSKTKAAPLPIGSDQRLVDDVQRSAETTIQLAVRKETIQSTISSFGTAMKRTTALEAKAHSAQLGWALHTYLVNHQIQLQEAIAALESVTKTIKVIDTLSTLQRNALCRALYLTVWHALANAKPNHFSDLGTPTKKRLLSLVCQIPPVNELYRNMIKNITESIDLGAFQYPGRDLVNLVADWSDSWFGEAFPKARSVALLAVEEIIAQNEECLMRAHGLVMSMEEGASSTLDIVATSEAINFTKERLAHSMQIIFDVKTVGPTARKSAETLAAILSPLPHQSAWNLIRKAIRSINSRNQKDGKYQARACLLLAASAMTNITDYEVVVIWKLLHRIPSNTVPSQRQRSLNHSETCICMLEKWGHQGILKKALLVKLQFLSAIHPKSAQADIYVALLSAIKAHNEDVPLCVWKLFDLLIKVQQSGLSTSTYRSIEKLIHFASTLPTENVFPMINRLSDLNVSLALKFFYAHRARALDHTISFRALLPFFEAMVRIPTISIEQIWGCIHSPKRRIETNLLWPVDDTPILGQERLDLVEHLAIVFVNNKSRSPGVTLKHLTYCVAHIRYHGLKLSPAITRAISNLVIQDGIKNTRWMQTERLRWVLGLIAEGEGDQVMEEVQTLIYEWRRHVHAYGLNERNEAREARRAKDVLNFKPGW